MEGFGTSAILPPQVVCLLRQGIHMTTVSWLIHMTTVSWLLYSVLPITVNKSTFLRSQFCLHAPTVMDLTTVMDVTTFIHELLEYLKVCMLILYG